MAINMVGKQTVRVFFGIQQDTELTVEEEKRFWRDFTDAVESSLDGELSDFALEESDIDFSQGVLDCDYQYDTTFVGKCYGEGDTNEFGSVDVDMVKEAYGVDMDKFADAVERSDILKDIIDIGTAFATVDDPDDFEYIDDFDLYSEQEYWDR